MFKSYYANQLKYQNAGEPLQLDVVSRASVSLALPLARALVSAALATHANNSQLYIYA